MINKINITPVVLCGGSGTRLWPLSRTSFPKQFLALTGMNSLFQQALTRLDVLSGYDFNVGETLILTNEEHRFLVLDQLRELPDLSAKLLLEPEAKNTAPALTLAALQAISSGDDPILVVTPADQTVKNVHAFGNALKESIHVASGGAIVVLGIAPDKPETGFGYIKREGQAGAHQEYTVTRFVEKPSLKLAFNYIESGEYCWNSGIFVVRASVWLSALDSFRPDILIATKLAFDSRSYDQLFIRPSKELFGKVPSESIDFAVIESCPGSRFEIKMISLDAGWSDLGSWDSVWEVSKHDNDSNFIQGDVIVENSKNSLIYADHRLVSVVGLDDVFVIETADAVLVTKRNNTQSVKALVNKLSEGLRNEKTLHRKVIRPWGWFDTIDEDEGFKVKRIQVNPFASLSLQKHMKRSEHWVVVKGEAHVTCGEKTLIVSENQSTYIPLGETHRLSNLSKTPLEIIEIQTGNYLEEDDIVRFGDQYGRE